MSKSLDTNVPVFSLVDLQNDLYKSEFPQCLSEKGVFYLTDHNMSESKFQNFGTTTIDFFNEGTDQDKTKVFNKNPATRRGFTELESESTAKISDNGSYTDYSMCYSMGMSDNLFPSSEFEQVWTTHFQEMHNLAKIIAHEVLRATGDYSESSMQSLLDCDPLLRFRYFPEVPEHRCAESEPLRMAPHYDLSIVTLIHQTKCDNGFVSLRCNFGGTLVELPPIPNAIIVMGGAVATVISGGKVKAPIHQVHAPHRMQSVGSSRTSHVFFLRPKPEFEFSVPLANSLGLKIAFDQKIATFQDWVGGMYRNLGTRALETY
jgi:isopenicillin N synthase-like dioxygenase